MSLNDSNSITSLMNLGDGAKNISICIIDGGIDSEHSLLKHLKIKKIPLSNGIKITNFSHHGTAVCSQISGLGLGIANNANISSIAIFEENQDGSLKGCSERTLAKAIKQAAKNQCDIINVSAAALSVNGRGGDELRKAIKKCEQQGILVVAAVGNEGRRSESLPASLPTVLAVGACDKAGKPCGFNNHGSKLYQKTLYAPGLDMPVAIKNEGIALLHGSSFAAPIVTGVSALVKQALKANGLPCGAKEIRDWLINTATLDPISTLSPMRFLRLNINILVKKLSDEILKNNKTLNKEDFIMVQSNNLTPSDDFETEGELLGTDEELDVTVESQQLPPEKGITLEKISDPAANRNVHIGSVRSQQLQSQHVSGAEKVFLIGTLSYDFGREARLDYFTQVMGGENAHPFDPVQMAKHLSFGDNVEQSNALIWTLKIDGIPVYAIEPESQFAVLQYARLVEFLKQQEVENVERISIAGIITGETRLLNGQVIPTVSPVLRGMFNWSSNDLADLVVTTDNERNARENDTAKKEMLIDFLHRIYYELRNRGAESYERAINYAATNAYQMKEIFDEAYSENLFLNKISAVESPVSRPDSDCWDVVLEFFNPKERLTCARKLYRYTVDVSDVMPVTIGKLRSWYAY